VFEDFKSEFEKFQESAKKLLTDYSKRKSDNNNNNNNNNNK
jgi:hypothetical protein